MKLLEYEAKSILAKYGIARPQGDLVQSPAQARRVAMGICCPVVVKAQIPVAGRSKAGGILFASSSEEAGGLVRKMLNSEIKGFNVRKVLLEEKISVNRELFCAVTVDRSNRCYVIIASSMGGVDIEEVAVKSPASIFRMSIDPLKGFQLFHARKIVGKLGYFGDLQKKLSMILLRLYNVAMDFDAELAEMNPIVETPEGKFVATDARLIIDDNALYRHPQLNARKFLADTETSHLERKAWKMGLSYVKLEGNIGIIGNGAGLVMATLDMVKSFGGNPANFLDVGGGASADKIESALSIVISDANVDVVFMNILGGITRCDDVAKGIIQALEKNQDTVHKPIVVRLVGTNEEEGTQILIKKGVNVLQKMEEATKRTVQIAKRRA